MPDDSTDLATDDVPEGVDPPSLEEQLAYLKKKGWPTERKQ